jgi:hypothetical protein
MAPKPKRARTVRREASRAATQLARDRERVFQLSPGGRPDAPIDVSSASVVEVRSSAVPCPRCGGEHVVEEHAAVAGPDGARLRQVRLRCRRCGSTRAMWFRLPTMN